jgi:16S rRNA (guanine527-N7)-methyltransferase
MPGKPAPPSLAPALQDAAAALRLELSTADGDRLLDYLALLVRWNGVYNLTAVREPAAMLTQHLADCMAVVPPLRRHLRGAPARLLDVGSGGGLPGVVLALLCPSLDVTCVDTVGKKAAFIRQVAAELRLSRLHALHARAEELQGHFDLITARAFSTLTDLVSLTQGQLAAGGTWLAMKGKPPIDEIAALPNDVDVFHVEPLSVPGLAAERCLVWMRRRVVQS